MYYYSIAPSIIARTDSELFVYSNSIELQVGQIVQIELGKKQVSGVVVKKTAKPNFEVKHILEVYKDHNIPKELLDGAIWISKYYATHLAQVIALLIPKGLFKKRRSKDFSLKIKESASENFILNPEQQQAIEQILCSKNTTHLLHGVTGSGKTAVYIELAKKTISDQKSVIILVPEISLTPQTVARFSEHFKDIITFHSQQTEAEKIFNWKKASKNKSCVVIGTRSALFLPIKKLGAIIVDECHEPSYKQENNPRYSAVRVASVLAKNHSAKLILGSATPAVTDFYLAKNFQNSILTLSKTAKTSKKPNLKLVDSRKRTNFLKNPILSDTLLKAIDNSLQKNQQVLLFHNRRGTAPVVLCEACGFGVDCPACYLPLTLHADKNLLKCHNCEHSQSVPVFCPSCKNPEIIYKGFGTKRILDEIQKIYPNKKCVRYDNDNTKSETLAETFNEVENGNVDILIGTQILAKGLDLQNLSTVGVIQAESGLALPDFSARERTFQLLHQVTGRVGRNQLETNVIIQSFKPDEKIVQFGMNQDFDAFYKAEIIERKRAFFPPHTHLLKITCQYKTLQTTIKHIKNMSQELKKYQDPDTKILPPTPAFHERLGGNYRWQIIVKSKSRSKLIEICKQIPSKNWTIDLDPSTLL